MKSGREWNNEDKVQRQILWKRPNVDMGNKKEHDDLGTYMSQKHIQNPYFCPILKQWECACLLREGDNTVNKMYSRSKGWPGYLIFIQILDSTCDLGTAGGEHWIGKLTGDAINGYSGYKRHMYLAGILVTGREVGVKVYSGSEDSRMYENGVCCCYKGLKKNISKHCFNQYVVKNMSDFLLHVCVWVRLKFRYIHILLFMYSFTKVLKD